VTDSSSRTDAQIQRRYRVRITIFLAAVLVLLPVLGQVVKISNTIRRLNVVEAERDQWQKPSDVIAALNLHEGSVVADVGCGAGYFALKLSHAVGRSGKVLAVDMQRLPLTFLWLRAVLDGLHNISVLLGAKSDPHLPAGGVDSVLVANTYHEFADPELMLDVIVRSLAPGGRLVVLDRSAVGEHSATGEQRHELSADTVDGQLRRAKFEILERHDAFIEQPSGDRWWMIVADLPQ
jgi:ubiquinone/menaquinone biosynthesis C-methylase UbiE